MQSEHERWTDKVLSYGALLLFLPALIVIIDGLITLVTQVVYWLRVGEWVPQTLWDGLQKFFLTDRPKLDWAIPNQVLSYILDFPRAGGMIFLGTIYLVLVSFFISAATVVMERATEVWAKRHEEPIFVYPTFTRREKIKALITIVWLIGFPTAVAIAVPDTDKSKVWTDMVGVGAVVAFWFWAITIRTKNKTE
jgi:hypothetical protein